MTTIMTSLGWLKSGLVWRTFFLLAALITLSMAAWVASFRMVERTPQEQQMAAQIISVVTITRAALTHSAPELRRELLFDLASNEGIRIYPLEKTDRIEPTPEQMRELKFRVQERLGQDTKFAGKVNGVAGFWISFKIDDDAYWLMLDRGRIKRITGLQWLWWAGVVLMLSLLGAIFISRLINLPLARLAAATRAVAKGLQYLPLPESGPPEILQVNRSFNQMVQDLQRVESDRNVVLAGISHDLRTPLARMQLELEMADLSDHVRFGMQSDLMQMDAIIGQFLDYAKPLDTLNLIAIDISALLMDVANVVSRLPDVRITTDIQPDLTVMGNATDLKRAVNNLLENARRYGKTHNSDVSDIHFVCHLKNLHGTKYVVIEITDDGCGVPESEKERLMQPFVRLDAARGQANGAGLGLAIVKRIVQRHGGQLSLHNRNAVIGAGLVVQITLPALNF